jgi:periplasmic protein CpxP/Spy
MSRFRSFVVIAMAALMVAAGVIAYAQDGSGGAAGGFGRGRGRPGAPARGFAPGPGGALPLAQLNLAPAQQDQVRQLVQQSRDQQRTAVAQLRSAMEEQRKAVETLPVDEGLIRSTSQALADAETTVAVGQARLRSDIFALLTPDQQARLKMIEAQRSAGAPQGPPQGR